MRPRAFRSFARLVLLTALAAALWAPPSAAETGVATQSSTAQSIAVTASPIVAFHLRETTRTQFGALEFRGGLALASPHKDFGGISALRIQADGQSFIALTDRGHWLTGRIRYDGGRPVGLSDVQIAPILGPDGRPVTARRWYDTEALGQDGGTLYVGIERVNRILRFDFSRHGVLARGQEIAIPAGVKELPNNRGLECLAVLPNAGTGGGGLVAISELGLNAAGDIRGFLIGGPQPGEFWFKRRDEFDVSDCAVGPAGDLFVLERRFSLLTGVTVRIRRIAHSQLRPGATVDGPDLMTADMGHEIDNMEGLSVHRAADGILVLTLISDDNFSPLQRTVLLQFTLAE